MKESKDEEKKLQERYDVAVLQRRMREAIEKPFKDRVESIFSSPRSTITDFWCGKCKRDCSGKGYRQVCTIREKLPTAWFVGYCPEGHKLIRRITDKNTDPYYELSLVVARQRYELADALLTPEDPRFKVVYPKQYEELTKKQNG